MELNFDNSEKALSTWLWQNGVSAFLIPPFFLLLWRFTKSIVPDLVLDKPFPPVPSPPDSLAPYCAVDSSTMPKKSNFWFAARRAIKQPWFEVVLWMYIVLCC